MRFKAKRHADLEERARIPVREAEFSANEQESSPPTTPRYTTPTAKGHEFSSLKTLDPTTSFAREDQADRVASQFLQSSASADPDHAAPPVGTISSLQSHSEVIGSSGQRLEPDVRGLMESRLGHDFSQVRIHADSEAAQSSQNLGAKAFAVGNDIAFAHGRYAPDTREGKALLAHELTHIVQQTVAGPSVQRSPDAAVADADKDTGVVNMPPEQIKGDRGQYKLKVREAAYQIRNQAVGNALTFTSQVQMACEQLKSYAEPKLKEMEGEITAGDLVEALADKVLTLVGGEVTAKIGNEIAKKLAEEIYGAFSKKIKDKAKEATSNKDDIDALREAVNSLVHGAQDAATAVQEKVGSIIIPAVDGIVAKVNVDEPLSDAENDIIAPCYEAETSVIDSFLENFGIPNATSAKRIQLDVYGGLVEKFEEKHIWARASFRGKLEMGFAKDFGATELTLEHKAGIVAKEAEEKRKKELDAAGD